ncbi:MAG: LysE family transporter [Acinetobacter sp.]|nr:LysE family transporter [Acinetobacter sp.]
MSILYSIAFLHFLALLTPGPDILLIAKVAVSQGRRAAFYSIIGISLGIAVWVVITLTGFSLLLQQWQGVQYLIMLFGAVFLAKMGYAMVRSALKSTAPTLTEQPHQAEHSVFNATSALSSTQLMIQGLLVNLTNPKALIYFASVFSLAVQSPDLHQFKMLLGVGIIAETFLAFGLLAYLLSVATIRNAYQRAERWIDGLAGGLFLCFAILLFSEAVQGIISKFAS